MVKLRGGCLLKRGFKLSAHYGLRFCLSILYIYFRWTQFILLITFGYKLFPFSHYILQTGIYIFNVPQGYFTVSFQVFDLSMPNIMGTENCNQIMRVEQSMMGSHCDGMMQSIFYVVIVCKDIWCTVLSMTSWFSWSLRRAKHIHLFSDSLYYLFDSSRDHQLRIMGSYLYKHIDGDQIHLQAVLR